MNDKIIPAPTAALSNPLKAVTPAMADAVGKTFRAKNAPDDERRFQVTEFTEKSPRHKNAPAFIVIRLGSDSYHEPYAVEFLRDYEEVPTSTP